MEKKEERSEEILQKMEERKDKSGKIYRRKEKNEGAI